jgi:hypothetical protein
MKKMIKSWIDHKTYRIETYGWFDAFIGEPWEDMVVIPLEKTVKVIQWIPRLWNIRDWEGTDTLRVLDYHLSKVQKVLQEDPHHWDEKTNKRSGPIYAKQVKEARISIAKILEDEFCKTEWKAYYKKYGRPTLSKKGLLSKNNDPVSHKLFRKNYELAEKRKKEEYDKLFKNLKDNIECWWT